MMKEYIYKTPDGTRDLLFDRCKAHNIVKSSLSQVFKKRGYHEVITPALEYYDLFSLNSSGLTQEEMYKLCDLGGHMLVLRPDSTMPIARLVATRLKDAPLPLRLYYAQKVYRVNQGYKGKQNEINQSGVELIGADGFVFDVEIVVTAARSLSACGIDNYTIEIGHAGIYKKLAAALIADSDTKERIRVCIESKNYASLEEELESLPENEASNAIKMLPRLFGGSDVFLAARDLLGQWASEELSYLKKLYDCLSSELDGRIKLDLGLVNRNNYYSGIVFRGYTSGMGKSVLSGGRYDNLFCEFEKSLPSIGFAADVDAISEVLISQNMIKTEQDCDTVIFSTDSFEINAIKCMEQYCDNGKVCELMQYESDSDAIAAAVKKGAAIAVIVGRDIRVLEV